MSNVQFDDITYNPSGLFPERNQYEAYPITNLGKMTSSLESGSFILMLPSFHEATLLKERTEKLKFYHDTLYLGFTALDNATNSECSREYNSGWWYPHALHYDWDSDSLKEYCTHRPFNGTNLNGVFDVLNPNKTTRTIAFCQFEDVNACIKPTYKTWEYLGRENSDISGWNYNNMTTYKLKATTMWLRKKM